MNINLSIKDKDGLELNIGDCVKLYNWGCDKNGLIGEVTIIFDETEGRISCEPLLVQDAYDFISKALPRCEKILEVGPQEDLRYD